MGEKTIRAQDCQSQQTYSNKIWAIVVISLVVVTVGLARTCRYPGDRKRAVPMIVMFS